MWKYAFNATRDEWKNDRYRAVGDGEVWLEPKKWIGRCKTRCRSLLNNSFQHKRMGAKKLWHLPRKPSSDSAELKVNLSCFVQVAFLFIYFITHFHSVENRAKDTIAHAVLLVDQNQERSSKSLKERTHDVYRLKSTLERAIKAQMNEFSSLAEQRNRLMQAMAVLEKPESIGTLSY